MKDKKYTAADITDLGDREHVRLRTQVYLGSMSPTTYSIPILTEDQFNIENVEFIPAVYKAIGEIIDNSLDEFSQISSKVKLLKIEAKPETGWYKINDNGRGIPIEQKEDRSGKTTWVPELVLSRLRSGRNFSADKEVGVIGQNGVGSACTNFCSSDFEVTVKRDNQQYVQKFVDGVNKISKPRITTLASSATGTEITFQLDPLVFKDVSLPEKLIHNRAIEIALTNPDVTVDYNGLRYRFKKGFHDFIASIAGDKQTYCFNIDGDNIAGEIFIVFDAHSNIDEQMFTWVNSSLLFDGGKCNTQFLNAFYSRTIAHLEKEAKRARAEITKNDVRQGLLVLANLKIKNPEYDSQAKTRLTGPDLRLELVDSIETQWKTFSKKVDSWLSQVLSRATDRHHLKADSTAIDEHEKKKKLRKTVPGLLDATSKTRSSCQILITEGDSASGQISMSRNPATTAAFALTGKINNVYGCKPAEILKMGKITDLLTAIGLTPGKKAIRSDLHFGRIVIATDADYDGDNIFTLLTNLFFYCWPELFDPRYEPILYRMVAPNVCLVRGKQRIHFAKRSEYELAKANYKGYEVNYYKGLGSMSKADWDMCLSNESTAFIPILDDGNMKNIMRLLFGDDADARKTWLTNVD